MTVKEQLDNPEGYYIYKELIDKPVMTIDSGIFTMENIDQHFKGIYNILLDGIDNPEVRTRMIHLVFVDGVDVDLTISEYMFNLMMFPLPLQAGEKITSNALFWCEDITEDAIKNYIDMKYIGKYSTKIDTITMNQTIDIIFSRFRDYVEFQEYLMNTMNMEDTVRLMRQYPEFNAAIHTDISDVPIEDTKAAGMKGAEIQEHIIKNSDHCLRDSFRTGEATSLKQYKEVQVSIGTKTDGQGSVYPVPINSSFINGGLNTPSAMIIESSVGRQAQMLAKNNVGFSGNFARLLGLNCEDTKLFPDPNYSCDTHNFINILVKDKKVLKALNNRYYRMSPNGLEHKINSTRDFMLIGKTILLRSPMTCKSFAEGRGICYKCYGDLAYINHDINIGKMASEELSSRLTQKLLSAKHLLESKIIKMNWCGPFFEYFEVYIDCLCTKSDVNYSGLSLVLGDIESNDEYDDLDYNYYVSSFGIRFPDDHIEEIHTAEMDDIYLQPELIDIINKKYNKEFDEDSCDIEIPFDQLTSLQNIFRVEIKNNELQATLNEIKNIINVKGKTSTYDKDTIIMDFLDTTMKGGIFLNSVHYEVILANQIRDSEDILELPNWEIPNNQNYQILTLNSALMESPHLMSRLLYSKLAKTLINPNTFKIHKPSVNDVFAMVNPTKYINSKPEVLSPKYDYFANDNSGKDVNPFMKWKSEEEYYAWKKQQEENSIE